jgi:hypothetical protein
MCCIEIVDHWNSSLEQECCLCSFICVLFLTHVCTTETNAVYDWRYVVGLSHVVSPGAITTPSLAQAPGILPTWQQCTASYFSDISFVKDHYNTRRPNTVLKTSVTNQGPTYFLKTYKPIQNSRYQEGDKHKPYCRPVNIGHHLTTLVTQVNWTMGFVHLSGWLNFGTYSNIFCECELNI